MLNIALTTAHMGKLANNIEHHGAEDKNAFDLPISEIELSLEQLRQLFDDAHADVALYNTTRTGDVEPYLPIMNPHPIHGDFKDAVALFNIGGLEFTLQGCKISKLELELQRGGVSKLSFTLRVRPEKDKQFLAFLGHQNRTIKLDIQDAKLAEKGGREQPSLFDGDTNGQPPIDGRAPQSDEQIGKAQADALARSTPAKAAAKKASKSTH
ncbi:MAG: hypothetical protein ABI859_16870 [Pseudomonadota bacterium]